MRRQSVTISIFTVLFFIFGLTGNILIADPTFSSIAQADDKHDGKIKLKKSIKKKKRKKNDDKGKDSDRGGNGLPKKVRQLQAGLNALQTQVDNIELTPGPQGEPGPAGTNGTDGLAGAVGPTGPAGAAGTNGADGLAGAVGPTGPAGPAGANGTDGLAGAVGPTGPQGSQGQVGFQGPQGDTGPQGPQGNTGLTGPAGPSGTNVRPILYSGHCSVTRSGITGFHRYCLDRTDFNTAGTHLIASPSGIIVTRVSGYYRITAHTLARSANRTQARVMIGGVQRHYQRDESRGQYIQSKVDVIEPILAGQNFWVEFFSADLEAFIHGNSNNSKLQVTFLGPLN
jgi:hypothetical protein